MAAAAGHGAHAAWGLLGRPTKLDGGASTGYRERFELLLLRRLDQHRVGTAREAKRLIGGAWRTIIDDMYKRNAKRLSAEQGVVLSAPTRLFG
jgi:hypothetical protein